LKDTSASTKIFGGFCSLLFALVAEKFEKMSKMKLLSSYQLATLLAKQLWQRCKL